MRKEHRAINEHQEAPYRPDGYQQLALSVIERAIEDMRRTTPPVDGVRNNKHWWMKKQQEILRWAYSDDREEPGNIRFWFELAGLSDFMLMEFRNALKMLYRNRKQVAEQRIIKTDGVR